MILMALIAVMIVPFEAAVGGHAVAFGLTAALGCGIT
jgi:hypothetical protein